MWCALCGACEHFQRAGPQAVEGFCILKHGRVQPKTAPGRSVQCWYPLHAQGREPSKQAGALPLLPVLLVPTALDVEWVRPFPWPRCWCRISADVHRLPSIAFDGPNCLAQRADPEVHEGARLCRDQGK